VKILFDTSAPRPLAKFLRGHQVLRTRDLGWQCLQNGNLLSAAEEADFDVLITCDQSIPYQQNFRDRKISVVVLSTTDWRILRPVAARIATLIEFVQRGQVTRIDVTRLRDG
jgi:hypothetical protein